MILKKYNLILWLCIIVAIIYYFTSPQNKQYIINGNTMGTSYTVKYWTDRDLGKNQITDLIENKLIQINKSVSTWDKNSEISKFNNLKSTDWFKVDKFFMNMVVLSDRLCKSTNGNFDITISPLIDLWGFDAKGKITKRPNQKSLDDIGNYIGCDKISIDTTRQAIAKKQAMVTINLSAIAKGGAVDEIGKILEQENINNYLVEIGGEIRARGSKINKEIWRIGIEQPTGDNKAIKTILPLNNETMATSGDYKNYFEENGARYSHIINPNTKKPIIHNLASVTVIHKDNAMADGLATAMLVMGKEEALRYATQKKLKIYMIIRENNVFKEIVSPEWVAKFGKDKRN